jgi:hypothetical protein
VGRSLRSRFMEEERGERRKRRGTLGLIRPHPRPTPPDPPDPRVLPPHPPWRRPPRASVRNVSERARARVREHEGAWGRLEDAGARRRPEKGEGAAEDGAQWRREDERGRGGAGRGECK